MGVRLLDDSEYAEVAVRLGIIRSLIDADVLTFLEKDAVMNALAWYHDISAAHFADAYVAAVAVERQSPLISFDRGLQRIPDLEVIATPDALSR
jgi:predicted nucleic acid-binding protein